MRLSTIRGGLTALLLAIPLAVGAQESDTGGDPPWARPDAPFRTVFAELGGAGYVFTVNVQLRLTRVWLRVGAGGLSDRDGDVFWGVPLMAGTFFGRGPHFLETGGGVVLVDLNDPEPVLEGVADIGYRFVHPNGLTFRAMLTPHFGLDLGWFGPWAGLSLGYTF
ncbi:MAG TPA: hypothetical protein VMM12_01920 [Longimicrobiales bacterium]|nr:hypothetical protein [Longimicrobiales bacterium]